MTNVEPAKLQFVLCQSLQMSSRRRRVDDVDDDDDGAGQPHFDVRACLPHARRNVVLRCIFVSSQLTLSLCALQSAASVGSQDHEPHAAVHDARVTGTSVSHRTTHEGDHPSRGRIGRGSEGHVAPATSDLPPPPKGRFMLHDDRYGGADGGGDDGGGFSGARGGRGGRGGVNGNVQPQARRPPRRGWDHDGDTGGGGTWQHDMFDTLAAETAPVRRSERRGNAGADAGYSARGSARGRGVGARGGHQSRSSDTAAHDSSSGSAVQQRTVEEDAVAALLIGARETDAPISTSAGQPSATQGKHAGRPATASRGEPIVSGAASRRAAAATTTGVDVRPSSSSSPSSRLAALTGTGTTAAVDVVVQRAERRGNPRRGEQHQQHGQKQDSEHVERKPTPMGDSAHRNPQRHQQMQQQPQQDHAHAHPSHSAAGDARNTYYYDTTTSSLSLNAGAAAAPDAAVGNERPARQPRAAPVVEHVSDHARPNGADADTGAPPPQRGRVTIPATASLALAQAAAGRGVASAQSTTSGGGRSASDGRGGGRGAQHEVDVNSGHDVGQPDAQTLVGDSQAAATVAIGVLPYAAQPLPTTPYSYGPLYTQGTVAGIADAGVALPPAVMPHAGVPPVPQLPSAAAPSAVVTSSGLVVFNHGGMYNPMVGAQPQTLGASAVNDSRRGGEYDYSLFSGAPVGGPVYTPQPLMPSVGGMPPMTMLPPEMMASLSQMFGTPYGSMPAQALQPMGVSGTAYPQYDAPDAHQYQQFPQYSQQQAPQQETWHDSEVQQPPVPRADGHWRGGSTRSGRGRGRGGRP